MDIVHDPKREAAKADYVVCRRVADWPNIKGSERLTCCACPSEIWLSPSSPSDPKKICDNCFAALIARNPDKQTHYLATSKTWGEHMKRRIEALAYWRRPQV